jgi:hypothetical protein
MGNQTTKRIKVTDIKEGMKADLESCPYLKNHPTAEYEYAEVSFVQRETPDCMVIGYEGIDPVGYPVNTELVIAD